MATDPPARAAPDPSADSLARVRRYTWWALIPFPPLAGAVTLAWLLWWDRAWPVTAVLILLALVASGAGWYLLDRSLRLEPFTLATLGRRGRAVTAAGTLALLAGIGLAAAAGGAVVEWSALASLLCGCLALLAPRRRRTWVIAGTGAAVAGLGALAGVEIRLLVVAAVVIPLGGWGIWQTWWYFAVARRLDRARSQAAELAVANERLRFAAELHDVQGHHLQVIALKSELAARLAEADPAAAAAEMRQVQRLAREALTETRSLVGGYRKVSLGTEIANATRVLAAADIDARPRLGLAPDGRLGAVERLLGLVVREATTNILRHTSASWARITLEPGEGTARLVVANDGAAGPGPDQPGNGLAALAERLAAVGGTLHWGRQGAEFTVTATAPLPPPGAGE